MNTPTPTPAPRSRAELIASLSEEITPGRRVKPSQGYALIALGSVVAAVISVVLHRLWMGIFAGEASSYFWINFSRLLPLDTSSTAGPVAGSLVGAAWALIADPALRKRYSTASLKAAPSYTWEEEAQQLVALYSSLLSPGRGDEDG